VDAEGFHEDIPCPECGSVNTVTYRYVEGFTELECPACGYRSDAQEISDLTRYQGVVLERDRWWADGASSHDHQTDGPSPDGRRHRADDLPPVPIRALKA